ncbi:MAG TPA: hypothetical protein VF611_16385, partial [Pyrinomonadaceae bacterium]
MHSVPKREASRPSRALVSRASLFAALLVAALLVAAALAPHTPSAAQRRGRRPPAAPEAEYDLVL